MLCLQTNQEPSHSWKHRNPQFEEIVSNLKLLTHDFSALLDECSYLIDVIWVINDLKRWRLWTVTNIKKIYYFCLINIWSVCCTVVTDGGGRGANFPLPGKVNVKTGIPLSLYFSFSILLVFNKLSFFAFFGQF